MVTAEEFGITQANVEEMKKSANPDIKRFLGEEADSTIGADLGLRRIGPCRSIKAVGNYGEAFDRNVGAGSPLKIERGLNALWNKGGLQIRPADPLSCDFDIEGRLKPPFPVRPGKTRTP